MAGQKGKILKHRDLSGRSFLIYIFHAQRPCCTHPESVKCHRSLEFLLPHCNKTYSVSPFQPFGWTVKFRGKLHLYVSIRTSQVSHNISLLIDIARSGFFKNLINLSHAAAYFQSSRQLPVYQNSSPFCTSTLSLSTATTPALKENVLLLVGWPI
jgi:hypothetical protein